jgi:putative transposase
MVQYCGKGRATDNICIERFWRSAKCERIYLNEYSSINALQKDVDEPPFVLM